jgi:carboxyl-terminal processing protease
LRAGDLESFDYVWKSVNDTYFDPTFNGVNWPSMRDRYRPQIDASEGLEEFIDLTNRMLFELDLSHFLVATDQILETYMPTLFAPATVGVDLRWISERAVVSRVRDDSPGARSELQPGYVITHIDGTPVAELVLTARPAPPYNPRNRRGGVANFLMGHLDGADGTSVDVEFLDDQAQPHQVALTRESRGDGTVLSEAMPPVHVEFESELLPSGIGYVWFNHFAAPVDQKFVDALANLRDAPGLIIDLRGNPGGYFHIVDIIAQQLINEETPLYRFELRDQVISKMVEPAAMPYQQPVAVLVDETSLSSSEHFAACLQGLGRAVIVGNKSPGYLLGAKWERLPNGLSFMHAFLRPVPYGGALVEGRGVTPDIAVALDISELLLGRDSQLEAAVDYILGAAAKRATAAD